MKRMTKSTSNFTDRVRFNWGYHDGARDESRCVDPEWSACDHFDQTYVAGYRAGRSDECHGDYTKDSDAAWSRHMRSTRAA